MTEKRGKDAANLLRDLTIATLNQELAKERHRNLTIWKEAMALVNDVYTTTKTFPKDEVWGRLRLPTRPFEKAQMHFCSDAQMPRSVKTALAVLTDRVLFVKGENAFRLKKMV